MTLPRWLTDAAYGFVGMFIFVAVVALTWTVYTTYKDHFLLQQVVGVVSQMQQAQQQRPGIPPIPRGTE